MANKNEIFLDMFGTTDEEKWAKVIELGFVEETGERCQCTDDCTDTIPRLTEKGMAYAASIRDPSCGTKQ